MAKQLDLDILVPEDTTITLGGKHFLIRGDYLTTQISLEIRRVQEAIEDNFLDLEPLSEFVKKVLADNNPGINVGEITFSTKQAYTLFEMLAKEVYMIEEIQLTDEEKASLEGGAVRPLKTTQDHKKKKSN